MKNEKSRQNMNIAVLLLFATLALGHFSWADIIYFKTGGSMEGIIREETDASVVIDLGVGTMTVRKDEIERIEKAAAEENQRLEGEKLEGEISSGEWAPLGYEEARMSYIKSKKAKESLKKSRANSLANKEETSLKEEKIAGLLNELDKKSKELKTIDPKKRIKEYNTVVAEINSLSAELNKENSALKDLYAEGKKLNLLLAEKTNKYRTTFQAFKDALAKKQSGIAASEASYEELAFFEEMGEKVSEMEGDFKKDIVGYASEDNQVIVDALIDGLVLARLVVDTGASIVVISKDVAGRLGITDEEIDTEIEIIMANGTAVLAKPVILKSVKVGDAEVKNVQAAILESNVIAGVDGLLGMSFLSNFIVSVDTASKKLILEEVL